MVGRNLALAAFCIALGSSMALAQQRPPANPTADTADRAGYPYPTQQALNNGVYDLTSVFSQAAAAHAEERRAESELNITVIRMKREFETSPEYKGALQELNQAYDALDAARKPVLEQVSGDPHYQDLNQKHEKMTAVLEDGNLSTRAIFDLALRKMQYGSDMRKMESDALNNDSAVQSARARLVAASQKATDMRDKFEATIYQNPQWAAAKQALENSRISEAGAQGAVVGALYTAGSAADADARHTLYGATYSQGGAFSSYGDPYYGRHF